MVYCSLQFHYCMSIFDCSAMHCVQEIALKRMKFNFMHNSIRRNIKSYKVSHIHDLLQQPSKLLFYHDLKMMETRHVGQKIIEHRAYRFAVNDSMKI